MNILELLVGKKMKVMTDVGIEVIVEIKSVKQHNYREDLEPATRENDWYPAARNWSDYTVTFTTGKSKTFSNLEQIKIIDNEL